MQAGAAQSGAKAGWVIELQTLQSLGKSWLILPVVNTVLQLQARDGGCILRAAQSHQQSADIN